MRQYPGYIHQTEYNMMMVAYSYNSIYPYCKNAIVLDLGANIGSFTYLALKNKAKKVYAIEASKPTFKHLQKQPFIIKMNSKVKLLNKAVIGKDEPKQIKFYDVQEGENTWASSTQKQPGRQTPYLVDTINFRHIVDKIQPNVLKIDVEGSELDFDFEDLPQSIKAIALEIHSDSEKIMNLITAKIKKQFPKTLRFKDCFTDETHTIRTARELVAVR